MEISLCMMADALGEAVAETCLDAPGGRLGIAAVYPFPEDGILQSDVLYVVDGALAGEACARSIAESDADCAFLVAGSIPESLISGQRPYLRMKADYSANRALTVAIDAFRKFGEWHAKLEGELLRGSDLSRLCQIGTELIGQPILVYDRNYIVLGNSLHEDDELIGDLLVKRSSYYVTSPEIVGGLVRREAFRETFMTHGAAVYEDGVRGADGIVSLYVNLGRGATYDGRVVILYRNGEPIKPGDYQIAELFTEVVRLALRRPSLQNDDLDRVFRIYFADLLEGRAIEGRQLDDSLRLWDWDRTGSYLCLWSELSAATIESELDAYLSLRLELALPGACAVRHGKGIACVAVLTKGLDECEARRRFGEAMGGFSTGMGSSQPYADILETSEYFLEARIACEMGARRPSDVPSALASVTAWDDISLAHYHEQGVSRLSARHFCDPAVRSLLPYRGGQRDFYHTLKVYLENNMNLLHTSEALFIHRTTLFKHLKEIRAIIGVDLDDAPTRLRMLVSFEIMERGSRSL